MRGAVAVALAAVILIGAGFAATFFAWHQQDEARAFALGIPYTNYNWHAVHAQDRGCNACHGDHLAADVSRVVVARPQPELHGNFTTSYDIPMRVEDCLLCHGPKSDLPFAESIHSLHLHSAAFANMSGNCNSCHATADGKLVLYDDESRYDALNGVQAAETPVFAPPAASPAK